MYKSCFWPIKKGFVLCVLFGCLLISGCQSGGEWVYPFNSLIVEYDISGDFNGKERFLVRGEMEAREAVVISRTAEQEIPIRSRIVKTGGKQYFFLGENMLQSVEEVEEYEEMKGMSNEERREFYLKEVVLDGAVFNRIGTDMVLGYTCDIYKMDFGTMCVWENVVLKKDIELMGIRTKMEAVSVQVDVAVSRDLFNVE